MVGAENISTVLALLAPSDASGNESNVLLLTHLIQTLKPLLSFFLFYIFTLLVVLGWVVPKLHKYEKSFCMPLS